MKNIITLILSVVCLFAPNVFNNDSSDEIYFGAGYNGSIYAGSSTEYISYSTKTETEYMIDGGLPRYYDTSTRAKTCANVAGTIVLGYYDKTFDNLIPDFTSARIIRDTIIYSSQTSAVQSVMDILYDKMETNSTDTGGTTVDGFKNGLKSYVNEQGYSITYSTTGSNNSFNSSAYINSIQNSSPIALFVSKYSLIPIADFSESETRDKLQKENYTGNHVLISYGLKEIKYYDADGTLLKTLQLLMVATGYMRDPLYYIDLLDCGLIDSYSINIY